MWNEWTVGLRGCIPVRELNEVWGSAWRRNKASIKTEYGCRLKIINLIIDLCKLPRWTSAVALRFLKESFPSFNSRKLSDHLTGTNANENMNVILNNARTYRI